MPTSLPLLPPPRNAVSPLNLCPTDPTVNLTVNDVSERRRLGHDDVRLHRFAVGAGRRRRRDVRRRHCRRHGHGAERLRERRPSSGRRIAAGASTATVSVTVNGDTTVEPDESFFGQRHQRRRCHGRRCSRRGNDPQRRRRAPGAHPHPRHPGQRRHVCRRARSRSRRSWWATTRRRAPGQLRGFFVQEEDADADADPATSEGIFVFCTTCPVAVSVGDKVRVTGASSEFFDMSQLTASTVASVSVLSSGNPTADAGRPSNCRYPVCRPATSPLATAAINAYFEPFEGMLVTFPDTLSVSEYFELARYGQVILNEGGRPRQFTDANTPTAAGLIDHEIELASRTIILDDTDNRQNRPVDTPNTPYYHPVPGLSIDQLLPRRRHDHQPHRRPALVVRRSGRHDAWRIRPVTEAFSYAFTPVNTRPARPERRRQPEGRQLQRPQLLPHDRHRQHLCADAEPGLPWRRQRAGARASAHQDAGGAVGPRRRRVRLHGDGEHDRCRAARRHRRRPARLRLRRHRRDRHRRHPGRDHLQDRPPSSRSAATRSSTAVSIRASSTPATVRRWPRPSRRSPPVAASRWWSTT